jgi:hypothetical protein
MLETSVAIVLVILFLAITAGWFLAGLAVLRKLAKLFTVAVGRSDDSDSYPEIPRTARYESIVTARSWLTVVGLVPAVGVVLWLSIAYSYLFAFAIGLPIAFGVWSLLTDRRWRLAVGEGWIVWESTFLGRRRALDLSRLAGFDLDHDSEGGEMLYFRKPGRWRRIFYPHVKDKQQFLAAVAAENPLLEIRVDGVLTDCEAIVPGA